jgi:hypothetical protein
MARPSHTSFFLALALAIVRSCRTSFRYPEELRELMATIGGALLDQRPSFSAAETYQQIDAFGSQKWPPAHGLRMLRSDQAERCVDRLTGVGAAIP